VEAEESASANEELSKQANMLKESLSRFKLKPNSSEASKVDSIRPEVMRMLEDMVEKKMSSHHLDESKHKGKGTRNLRQKLKYCWTTKSWQY